MIREVKKEAPPPKKRPKRIWRVLALILTLALIIGAVVLIINRDKLNMDSVKRWFTYRNLERGDNGNGAPFAYQGGNSMTLCACGGDMLAVSKTGARLYSPGGTAYVEDTFSMENPTCQVSGKRAVVYDAGGTALRVYRDRARVFERPATGGAILNARLNGSGYLTVVTRSSGHKGVVWVYDANCQLVLDLRLSSAYVFDALVAPDNHSLLVLTAGQQDLRFNCSLAQYSLQDLDPQSPTPFNTWSLGNDLPLDLIWDENGVRVLAQYSVFAADSSLRQTGAYSWPDRYLKRYSLLAGDSIVVVTGKYRSGSQTTLEVLDRWGNCTASMEESNPILDISAAGKYIGVLTSQGLNIYTHDLNVCTSTEDIGNAAHLAMLSDGSAFLASQDTAWLYLPN